MRGVPYPLITDDGWVCLCPTPFDGKCLQKTKLQSRFAEAKFGLAFVLV